MRSEPYRRVVAIDGGTTNTRARLVIDGRVAGTVRRPVGVRDSVVKETANPPLAAAVRDAIAEALALDGGELPDAVVVSGMMTSDAGLSTVDHVLAPAGLAELAQAAVWRVLPEIRDEAILLIPGVRTPPGQGKDGWIQADVMRGEECETFGAMSRLDIKRPAAFLWPGSHTKLVAVDEVGRIVRSYTTLAGELLAALWHHTLLRASLPEFGPESPDMAVVDRAAAIVEAEGLGRAAFLVRIADLTGSMGTSDRFAFLLGAVVADDAANLARHPILAGGLPVYVGGKPPLRELYAALLAPSLRGSISAMEPAHCDDASAHGAVAIANLAPSRPLNPG